MPVEAKWGKALERAREMSSQELRARLTQELQKRADTALFAVGIGRIILLRQLSPLSAPRRDAAAKTSYSLPPSPGRFFFDPSELSALVNTLKRLMPDQAENILRQAERICRHQFDLLGYEALDYGAEIDWQLDAVSGKRAPRKAWYKIHYLDFNEVGDHKVTWELNRHQHLVTLAKAWLLSGDQRFIAELIRQWRHWHRENPYPKGINWASSLEVAFRSLSWIWIGHLLADCASMPATFQRELARALALSARHIERYFSTYSSPNTHLLGEAVALFFIGALCPRLRSAPRWQALGWQTLIEQAERQVQGDGVYFEQSTYYHVYALDFFLHARTLAARNDIPIPASFDATLRKMLDVLCGSSQAGLATGFGDDDGGRVFDPRRNRREHLLDPLSTGAAIFRDAALSAASPGLTGEALWLLGKKSAEFFTNPAESAPRPASKCFPESGIYIMAGAGPREKRQSPRVEIASFEPQMAIDAGPQGAGNSGHGHADALSVQLSVAGEEWLIDPGAYRYVSSGGDRDQFRGTAAHNTLLVDGMSQADPGGPFAWRNLPSVRCEHWINGDRFDFFSGSHDGYMRLPQPVHHRRSIFYLKPRFWFVSDFAEGEGEHQLEVLWHFAPHFKPSYTPPGFTLRPHSAEPDERRGLILIPPEQHGWSPEFRRGWTSPAYGAKLPAPVLSFSRSGRLPAELATLVLPLREDSGKLSRIGGEADRPHGWWFETSRGQHLFLFGDAETHWQLGPWASDAAFVYAGIDDTGAVYVALCHGSSFAVDGRLAVASDRQVERCEVTASGASLDLSCSDLEAAVDCRADLLRKMMRSA